MTDLEFNILLGRAIHIWSGYDNAHNYALGKIKSIIDLSNTEDSILTIYGMFDGDNQQKLFSLVGQEIAEKVLKIYFR